MKESELEAAKRHVTQGRRIVAEQRARVTRLKAMGRDAYDAERDLGLFEDSLAIFEEHLNHLEQNRSTPTTHPARH